MPVPVAVLSRITGVNPSSSGMTPTPNRSTGPHSGHLSATRSDEFGFAAERAAGGGPGGGRRPFAAPQVPRVANALARHGAYLAH